MLRLNVVAAVVMFAALAGVVALQVINRLVLHLPIIWSEEVARFLFFWTVLLGAALGIRRRRHFVIDLAPRRPREGGGWPRFVREAVPDACTGGFCLFLLIQGIGYAQTGVLRTSTNAGVNMGLVYAAIPAFAALGVVYAVWNLVDDFRAFRSGRPVPHAPPPAE
jgi:TRAP-type C4-dicarboxylate transport system permease small subunit